MKPRLYKDYKLSSLAKNKQKGKPIKIGGGDSGFISKDILKHRRKKMLMKYNQIIASASINTNNEETTT